MSPPCVFFACLVSCLFGGGIADAQTVGITGLYTTGVRNNGTLLGNNRQDAHYVVNATGTTYDGNSRTVSTGAIPGAWTPNTATARWITTPGPASSGGGSNGSNPNRPGGNYDYTLTFTMPTGAQVWAVSITGTGAVDDSATIYVNGVLVSGQTITGYGSTNSFTLSSANASFVAGNNTITFRVNNGSSGPTGLLVTSLSGTVVVPEVGAFLPVVGALALVAGVRVRRRWSAPQ